MEWQDYWGKTCLQSLLDKLFLSWHEWLFSRFNREKLNNYIYDYFRLLETGLDFYHSGMIDRCFLSKIVAFETFFVSTPNSNNHAAALFSTRNPNYLLHKIPNPIACDDPKYLPVISLREPSEQIARLYYHYRRIPIKQSRNTQLFLYPAVGQTTRGCTGFDVIDTLFRNLTRNNDPWVKLRCASLAKLIFDDLVISLNKPTVKLLDLGYGSAQISMRLCTQAYSKTKTSFDVSLVDTIPSRLSIARSFYRNYLAFESVHYRRSDMFNWVSSIQDNSATYDITLVLRVFDTLCQYQMESLPIKDILASMNMCGETILDVSTSQQIQNMPERIIHSLHKIQTQQGSSYWQPGLRDFFKAVSLCCNINNFIHDNAIVLPVRSFSDNSLIMEDGVSILKRIMEKSQYLIIEDSDISLDLLCKHAKKCQLGHLTFASRRSRQDFSGSHRILVSHGNH
jgi:hypothetical protein